MENLKKLFIFQENEAPKKLHIFWEVTFRAPKMKKACSEKTSYISEKGTL